MISTATACNYLSTGGYLRVMRTAIELGRRVEQLRRGSGLEQADVCKRADLSRAYLSRLENGGVTNPKLYDLQKIAEALGTTVSDLTGDHVSEDDAALFRRLLGVRLGTAAAEQLERVVEGVESRDEADRRALVSVLATITAAFPATSRGDQAS